MHLRCHCFWRFSRPAPLLGKHIITEFVLVLFLSIKAAMDLLSIAILLQLMCLFLLPSKQSSGKSSIYGFCFGRREEGIKGLYFVRVFNIHIRYLRSQDLAFADLRLSCCQLFRSGLVIYLNETDSYKFCYSFP